MSIQLSPNGTSIKMNFPIMKSEKLEDGRLMIEGVATSEAVDHANEIIDYDSAKAVIAAWKGNIREQHDPKKAVGKAIEVIADDASRQIILKVFVSKGAQDTQDKILDGTLSDFSIGGTVEKRIKEKAQKGDAEIDVTRLVMKRITEVSVVDSGCNPETSFSIVKADGESLILVGAEEGEAEEEAAKSEPTAIDTLADMLNKGEVTAEQLVAFAKGEQPAPAAAVAEQEAAKADEETETQKAMWQLQTFASLIQNIGYMVSDTAWEAECEGDNSPLPANLLEWLKTGVQIYKDMAEEETTELLASLGEKFPAPEVAAMVVENADGRTDDVAKAGARFSKSTKKALAGAHEAMKAACDHMDKLNYESDEDGDEAGKADGVDNTVAKALGLDDGASADDVAKAIAGMHDQIAKANDRIKALEAEPAPGKALLKVLAKADDLDPNTETQKTETVKSPDGNENDIATMIKSIHQSGGRFVG